MPRSPGFRTAAPAHISGRATIKVLTKSGYEVAHEGDNGAVCLVMRGFTAPTYTPVQFREIVYDPTIHAPICFTARPAARCRTTSCGRSSIAGMSPDQIARALETACMSRESFGKVGHGHVYMWSAHQHLARNRRLAPPRDGVRCQYYENAVGRRQRLLVAVAAGQRRRRHAVYVVVISADDKLAVK